jgi:hypothetical protein
MKHIFSILLLIVSFHLTPLLYAQSVDGEEPVLFYQMEPLDDSLFIQIQEEMFIDPPDPKSEIIVDLRDPNNQTVSIRGAIYPILAFSPEIRARITTFPFKINLEDDLHYASVFTRIFEKMRINQVLAPPSLAQISPGLHYINPFLQMFGGERFGIPIKRDIGISFGLGTPYSGPFETNFIEANFHILGFSGGMYSSVDAFTSIKETNNHNNLYASYGFQLNYVIPFGNFLQVGLTDVLEPPSDAKIASYRKNDTLNYNVKIIEGSYFNWEFRYPVSLFGSTRGKVYVARYLDEYHIGFTGRELSLAGSTFDFRFDAMPKSDIRQPQYILDIMVQRVFESWGFSAFAIGPTAIFSRGTNGNFTMTSVLINFRLKVGTSL